VQGLAIVHFIRRRPENYWFTSSFFSDRLAPPLHPCRGAARSGIARGVYQGFGRRSRVQIVERKSWISFAGQLRKSWVSSTKIWGNLRRRAKRSIMRSRGVAIPPTVYSRAQSSLGLNDLAGAIPDLEHVVAADRKFDYYRAAGLLADAYARTGQLERADQLFAEVTQISTTPETLYNYASFLNTANRQNEARDWLRKLEAKKRTLPRYMQRRERPWFRKGKALLKGISHRVDLATDHISLPKKG